MKRNTILLAVFASCFFIFPFQAHATVIFLTTTGSNTWSVPSDWNNSGNSIEVIGGGGGGTSNTGIGGQAGGGGGAYSKATNVSLTPDGTVTYAVGAGGTPTVNGGDTYFCNVLDSAGSCDSITDTAAVQVGAKGGQASAAFAVGGAGGVASSGVGTTKYDGGAGGSTEYYAGTGGGGAAGLVGPGGTGGPNVNGGSNTQGGGGGGGADNGSAGSPSSGGAGSAGGAGGAGANGGGSGGTGGTGDSGAAASPGGIGQEWDATHGAGGGGGGGGAASVTGGNGGNGGLYGAGGGGSGFAGTPGTAGSGAQGIIVITYTPIVTPDPPTNLTTTSANGSVSLGWTAPSGPLTSYGIWRGAASFSATTSATLIASISSASTNYSDTSAARGAVYFYRVTATNALGTSTLSIQKASGTNNGRIVRLKGMRLR